jgi:HEAT repeat protein
MDKQKVDGTNLGSLMNILESKDGLARKKAREALVKIGEPAVSSLITALEQSKTDQVRWEAAKALGTIGNEESIPALVKALEDLNADVAWLAAVGLKKFKKAAWPYLLRALVENGAKSALLCQGAHHVFQNQKGDEFKDLLAPLVKALEIGTVSGSAAVAANDMLTRMNIK